VYTEEKLEFWNGTGYEKNQDKIKNKINEINF
jgi:hypothetical protein